MMGKVYLVGAGPGDSGLLTVKGRMLLEQADVVVYDALVGDGVLSLLPSEAKQINVGKRKEKHVKPQEKINQILIEEAKKGCVVVRLKGGDPFLFGRGGEELEALKKEGISCEIVPGVTSALAVPAYSGIPVTHRDNSSSLHIFTGHRKRGTGKQALFDYKRLSELEGTLVFLMGVSSASEICEGLLEAGMQKETPAAFLQSGTTASQKIVCSTLEHIVREAREKQLEAPAVLVIGSVCGLSASLSWAEQRPLHGIRVLVTRPKERSASLSGVLREKGAEVIELPAIETVRFRDTDEISTAFQQLSEYHWLVFTSPAGAEAFLEELSERKRDLRMLFGKKIAVIGPATGQIFVTRGIFPDYMPERYYGKELGAGLAEKAEKGEKILLLRSEQGGKELVEILENAGFFCRDLALYHTQVPSGGAVLERVKQLLERKELDFVTFTSASTVHGFLAQLSPTEEELSGFCAVCIGTETQKAASRAGMRTRTAKVPSAESMAASILEASLNAGQASFQYPAKEDG